MATYSYGATGQHRSRRQRIDLLTWPVLGPFLRWRHARTAMQVPLFLLAMLILFDGLLGPQLAPKNLATVSVWLHYRGFVVLALLIAGNLFCMACPFMFVRQAGRWVRERLLGGGKTVPRAFRNKWIAVAGVLLFFFAYEQFDLWASPWLTAWVVAGYFLAALVVDTFFKGAAFCKYVCPLGQFNFFGSLISPLEVKVRDGDTCARCTTKDCITARPAPGPGLAATSGARGCELWLFQERKVGNADCTFCLDCVHACPYDNIGLIARQPGQELWQDPFRSGVGRFSRRLDLAVLVTVLAFGGFMNAFGMIPPVYALQERLATWLGMSSTAPGLLLIYIVGLLLLPAALLALAGWASRALVGEHKTALVPYVTRYVYALVPLGFGMWLAHYAFHFLTGALTIVPVIQSFMADIGLFTGEVLWELGPLVPLNWLFPIEAVFLYAGMVGSVIVAFQIARRDDRHTRAQVLGATLPWFVLFAMMLGAGLWILLQPMEMRGTMLSMIGG